MNQAFLIFDPSKNIRCVVFDDEKAHVALQVGAKAYGNVRRGHASTTPNAIPASAAYCHEASAFTIPKFPSRGSTWFTLLGPTPLRHRPTGRSCGVSA